MQQLGVGLIGYGFAGRVFHAPLIASVPGLALRRISCSDPAGPRRDFPDAQWNADPQAMLADPDIDLVVIATPNVHHFPLARAALEAGKHVVVEKPFVVAIAEGEALIALARERGRLISVFHNRRWDSDFLTVRKLVETGRLGKVYRYEAQFDRFVPAIKPRWREEAAPGAGVLFDLGAHLIDQALQLFGLPQAVFADIARQRPGAQVDDYFQLLLDYGDVKISLHASRLVREPGPRYQVHGLGGSFIKYGLDTQEAALLRGERPGHAQWGAEAPEYHGRITVDTDGGTIRGTVDPATGCYEAYYQAVHAAIADGAPPPVTAAEALDVIRVITCAQRSHTERRVVRLDE
jgi:scyllo-inositol 2-dehydrogenase (NADP+)